ncbi:MULTISPECIES: NAD-dependent epimerase/dehydratase family protein [unclassified Rhodococcus (in: high G+C Gram-positive bacteria)]|uniref:NAD-dependent epimerase/dehydratase family protein n=1 Tax=unclassified Rhodococcus (in: high G+C Gram-positive bacteria) TaxID=192944 RepID=UPI0015E87776|nr:MULTISPECIES: NAD-dependent epimerase/dehydratase family protein [unclassified Rhodococcus (in: high G+C Gram-positive bacteria)]
MPNIADGKFVVVGGASLLGSHIGEQLLSEGAREVILVDNLALGVTQNIEHLVEDKRCTFLRGDALRLNELFDPFTATDGVFNLAGFLTKPMSANPWLGIDVNIRGAQNILEASRIQGVKKVIFSSTTGVYGAAGDAPISDDTPLRWQNLSPSLILYCTSKIMGEGLGRMYSEAHGVDFLALRYSAVYGERQHKRALDATRMVDAYERIRSGVPAIIEGDGTGVQDYVYVGDVARANLLAMQSSATGGGINIATGVDTTQRRIIELITKACNSDLAPIFKKNPTQIAMPTTNKHPFEISSAERLIGWAPTISIEAGIERLVSWLDQQDYQHPTPTIQP